MERFLLKLVAAAFLLLRFTSADESTKCIAECIDPQRNGVGIESDHLKAVANSVTCDGDVAILECVTNCPDSALKHRLRSVFEQTDVLLSKYCDGYPITNVSVRDDFLRNVVAFSSLWIPKTKACAFEKQTIQEFCEMTSKCVFGSALNASRRGNESDVVAYSVGKYQLDYAARLDEFGQEQLPSGCDVIFEPYQARG